MAIKRAAATFLVVAALLLQGMPFSLAGVTLASESVVAMDGAVPPCHEGGAAQQAPSPAQEQPAKLSMACCTAAICGMAVQALPPAPVMPAKRLASVFAPPPERQHAGSLMPDPAWRPPATFL